MFSLIQDCDCHWYVCPVDKCDEASDYFDAVSAYWEAGRDERGGPPDEPDYLVRVGGSPSRVNFPSFTID